MLGAFNSSPLAMQKRTAMFSRQVFTHGRKPGCFVFRTRISSPGNCPCSRSICAIFPRTPRILRRSARTLLYCWIVTIERAAAMWFTPRIALLPYSGKLWPLSESYRSNPTDFEVTLGLALLNVLYVAMGLAAAWSCRTNPGVLLTVAFILIRTAFLTQLQTCEPR